MRFADLDLRLPGGVVLAGEAEIRATREVVTPATRAEAWAALEPYERERHDRLRRPSDADDYLAAHTLVRHLLARCGQAGARLEQQCATCGARDHGRPRVRDHENVRVSLSHSNGWVAAAIASSETAAGPDGRFHLDVGVDLEARATAPLLDVLTPAERREIDGIEQAEDRDAAFTRLWVRKEALIKAGRGTLADAGELDARDAAFVGDLPTPRGVFAALALRLDPA